MKKIVQLTAACGLAMLCSAGTGLSATNSAQVSAETQKNLDALQTNRACPGCNLAGAELTRMKLAGANLEGANLSGARLLLADLAGANLRNANLSGANLGGADLAKADITGANLSGAVLEGTFISQEQIQSATGYTPEKRLEIPDEELPARDTADLPPDSDMRPATSTDDATELPLPEKVAQTVTTEQDAAASKPLPVAPAEIEQSQPVEDETVVGAVSPEAMAAEEKEMPAEPSRAQIAAPSTTTGTTAAKALPVAPGGDVDPARAALAQHQSETPVPEPIPETAVRSESVLPAQEAAQPAEQESPADEGAAVAAPPAEASQNEATLDSSREQLVKQLFKQKQCIDCDLSGLNFSGRDLEKFDLERANFANSNLSKTDLRKANLKGANLRGAMLQGADLRKADLYRADLRGADLSGARLDGALLDSASMDGSSAAPADVQEYE